MTRLSRNVILLNNIYNVYSKKRRYRELLVQQNHVFEALILLVVYLNLPRV